MTMSSNCTIINASSFFNESEPYAAISYYFDGGERLIPIGETNRVYLSVSGKIKRNLEKGIAPKR